MSDAAEPIGTRCTAPLWLRPVLPDTFRIAFMFNGGQSPASIFSPICIQICTGNLQLIHSNRINYDLYPEPNFPYVLNICSCSQFSPIHFVKMGVSFAPHMYARDPIQVRCRKHIVCELRKPLVTNAPKQTSCN